MVRIEVSSDFCELWRYNIFASCGGFDTQGQSLYVVGAESISSEEVNSTIVPLPSPPEGFDPRSMTLTLECESAAKLEIFVYVVAHTLPEDRVVENSPPFNAKVRIEEDGVERYREIHKVNQWGGVTINVKI